MVPSDSTPISSRSIERILPEPVLNYLGDSPELLIETDEIAVWAGQGYQAHIGPPEVVARERAILLRELQAEIPLSLPHVVDWDITWTVLEDLRPTDSWTDEQIFAAIAELSAMHERLESSPDLENPVFRRPFGNDCTEILAPARKSGWELPEPLSELLWDPSPLLKALRSLPPTLLHGDPWPANVALRGDERIWLNWWQASIGPGVSDFACWIDQTPFQVGRTVDRLTQIEAYLGARTQPVDRRLFSKALDAARLFWFLASDVPHLPELAEDDPGLVEIMHREALRALEAFNRPQ